MVKGKKKFQTIEYPLHDNALAFLFENIKLLFQEKGE